MEPSKTNEFVSLLSHVAPVTSIVPDYFDDDFAIIDNHNPLRVIDTLKPGFYLIAIVSSGTVDLVVDSEPVSLHDMQLIILPPQSHVSNIVSSEKVDCSACCVSSRLLQLFLGPFSQVWNEGVYVRKLRIFNIAAEEREFLNSYFALIRLLLGKAPAVCPEVYLREMLKNVINAALLGLCSTISRKVSALRDDEKVTPLRNVSLFNRFLQALQQEQQKHHTVEYYAAKLCISSKYLTMVCQKNSNKSARRWIDEYVQADINSMLADTDLSLKEVSVRLGFPNQSFFGKYVKVHYGCTPTQLRDLKRRHRDS